MFVLSEEVQAAMASLRFTATPVALCVANQRSTRFAVRATATGADLCELIETERPRPVIDRTCPLREAAEAIRSLEERHARAKVILVVGRQSVGPSSTTRPQRETTQPRSPCSPRRSP